jgi:hypothetical protein
MPRPGRKVLGSELQSSVSDPVLLHSTLLRGTDHPDRMKDLQAVDTVTSCLA